MIVPMKKVWVLTLARDEDRTLDLLGRVGVLHLEPSRGGETRAAAALREEMALLDRALELCGPDVRPPVPELSEVETLEKARRLVDVARLAQEDAFRLHALEQTRADQAPAFSVNPAEIQSLLQRGIQVTFRRALREDLSRIPESLAYAVIHSKGRERLLVFFTREETVPGWLSPATLPAEGPEEAERLVEAEMAKRSRHESEMKSLQGFSGSFRAQKARLADRLIFEGARAVLAHEGPVSILVGYCPGNLVAALEQRALESGWAVLVQEPDWEDPVPTLLRPSRTGQLFAPVMKILSVLPGYREGDPSALLVPFFALFTAMLLDDAGYGLLILLMGLLFRKRLRGFGSDAYILVLALGSATMVWGALHGTWFGLEAVSGHPVARALVLDVFTGPTLESDALALRLCLVIGVVHLSAARCLNAVRSYPSRGMVGEAGWIVFLWGMYGLIDALLLGGTLGWAEVALLAGGFLMAVLFAGDGRGSGSAVADVARNVPLVLLNGLGSLSDIVSYLRLFAVGLASRMLSVAFNDLAAGAWASEIPLSWVLGGVIFLAGHTTNILLAAMAVLVHGVRLNLLEFSKHAGTEWAGISYRPFAFKSRKAWEGARP